MTNQVIPAEAVDAALAANLAYKSQGSLDNTEKQMRAILEAAAPYIRDQGYLDGLRATRDSLLAFADDRDTALGAIRSHITTYELRTLLGAKK